LIALQPGKSSADAIRTRQALFQRARCICMNHRTRSRRG
jgi:hypothetical protein